MATINVIGGGLAGCEAAYYLAELGVKVKLYEQKPNRMSPAHHSEDLGELVCSNSLKSKLITTASGLLKAEMEKQGSLVLKVARACAVPAGGALAVDRNQFSRDLTTILLNHHNIEIIHKEVTRVPDELSILSTGPLTDGELYADLSLATGGESLHFFDAAAPIVEGRSIDMDSAFTMSRYDKGGDDYVNCPLTKEEYLIFQHELAEAERVVLKDFEKREIFDSCMPIEVIAKRGEATLRYGPLKPVGLIDPRKNIRPYAVLQLRKEDENGQLYNLVGCQTNLLIREQKRVFALIPALKNVEFVRYGVMHRNSYLDAPRVLTPFSQLRSKPNVYIAGQLSGVEGYMESAMSGLLCASNALRQLKGMSLVLPNEYTMTGALMRFITNPDCKIFQPMNANFGILPPLPEEIRDKEKKRTALSLRALESYEQFVQQIS